MGKPIIWSGTNAKLINSGDLVDVNSFSLSDGPKITFVTGTAHGWTSADIGRPVRIVSANQLAFAQADTAANAEVFGFIYGIIDNFTVRLSLWGNCPSPGANVLEGGGNFGASTVYFLSDTTQGKITAAEPSNVGSISKPLAIGTSLSSFTFLNYRGATVGSTNARTQISLPNNATTDVQSVSSYDAGSLSGYVTITNSTAANTLRFYVSAPFSKYGASGNYYISPSYVGDTPPTGFSMTVTAAGSIQITMPNVSGYVSATIVYSLNAPAVGTNFPLNLDSGNLTNNGITGVTGTAATTAFTAGSGKIGELVTTSSALTAASLNLNTLANVGNGTLTLSAGLWEITYDLNISITNGITTSAPNFSETTAWFQIAQGGVEVDNSLRTLFNREVANSGTNGIVSMQVRTSAFVNISTSTTYTLQAAYSYGGAGTGAASLSNSGNAKSRFYAKRLG